VRCCPLGQWRVRCAGPSNNSLDVENHRPGAAQLVSSFFATHSSPLKLRGERPDGHQFLPNRNVVFVVDDDPGMLTSVKRLLRANGYDSLLFSSANALKNHIDFDDALCVVLDINLDPGSGIELRYDLEAAGYSGPVIYMTGNDDPAVRKAALASGCVAFLIKPFSAPSLIEPLKQASAGRPWLARIAH
jgi:CheY-like chemotaxis protein